MDARQRSRKEAPRWLAQITLGPLAVASVALATGTALVVYLLAAVSLPIALGATGVITAGAALTAIRRMDPQQRAELRARARIGVAAGVLATAAYDGTRAVLVAVFDLAINPFEAVPLFGQLLLGSDSSTAATDLVGIAFHVANGVGFAIAFVIVAGRRGPLAGIAWGLLLEAAMLALYPGWLDIRARQEFTSVSVLGHVAYGATLGWSARILLARSPRWAVR